MSDIRLDVDFDTNPKIIKLKRRMNDVGLLCLIRLWCYAAKHRSDGVLTDMDAEDIAIACGWPGNEQEFIATLEQLRLIERTEGGAYAIHNWEQRNPWAAHSDERSELARKAVTARWNKRKDTEKYGADTERIRGVYGADTERMKSGTERMPSVSESDTERNTPFPSPSPSPAPFPFPSPTPSTPEAATEPATEPTNDEDEKEKKGGDAVPVLKNGEKHTIAADWQPKPDTLAMIGQMGITAEFADSCLPQFRLWHQEQGTVRNGFESLFVGWVKKAWAERKPDAPPGGRRKGQTMAEQLQETHERLFGQDDIDPFSFRLIEGEAEHVH